MTGPDPGDERFVEATRLVFFSDAVVAIAITLLAIELPLPEGITNAEVLGSLNEHQPEYRSFLISFLVIWAHWAGHHRLFRYIDRVSSRLIVANMLWLLTIVVMPFATRVLSQDGAFETRFCLYAAVQFLSGLFLVLIVRAADRQHLLEPGRASRTARNGYRRSLSLVLGFGLSIPLAFLTPAAYLLWAAIPLFSAGLGALQERRDVAGDRQGTVSA